jgi:hypothetical protein
MKKARKNPVKEKKKDVLFYGFGDFLALFLKTTAMTAITATSATGITYSNH